MLVLLPLLLSACAGAPASLPSSSGPSPVIATIPLDTFTTDIAVTPDGSRVIAAGSTKLFVIDTATNQVVATITPGDTPYGVAVARDGARAFAVDLMQRDLWILDLQTNRIEKTVGLGAPRTPQLRPSVALAPDGSRAFVTMSQPQGPDSLYVIDTTAGSISQRHGFDFHPGPVRVAPDGSRLYVAGCHGFCSDGTLHALDATTLAPLGRVETGSVPGGLAISPDGTRAWVTNGTAASVSVVDLSTLRAIATIPVAAGALGVIASPDGSRVYVTSFDAGTLTALDARTNAVLATARIGDSPRALALSPDGRRAYVTSSRPIISVVDTTRLGP